jgi:hypothetical protein
MTDTAPDHTKYYRYLDALRESGQTNMYWAAPYLTREFPELDRAAARKVLADWMETFEARHPRR